MMKHGVLSACVCGLALLAASGCVESTISKTGRLFGGKDKEESAKSDKSSKSEDSKVISEYDFVVEIAGRRRSVGHTSIRTANYKKNKVVESVTTQKTTVVRNGQSFDRNTERKLICAPDGSAIFSEETTEEAGLRTHETIRIEQGLAKFETEGEEGIKKNEVAVPAGVTFGIDSYWLSRQPLAEGKNFSAKVLSRGKGIVTNENATVNSRVKVSFRGQERDCWVVKYENDSAAGNKVTMILTTDGQLVEMRTDGAAYRVVDKTEAARTDAPIDEAVTSLPVDFALPSWDSFDSVTLELLPAEQWSKLITENEYISVDREGGAMRVTLRQIMPSIPDSAPFPPPPAPAELKPFLASTGDIRPDDPDIKREAAERAKGSNDSLEVVAKLAGWVYQTIKYQPRGRMNQPPATTLRNRSGDCSEHADLFASMARSLGLPTRHCSGLLLQKQELVYHAWVEVYIGGAWVPVDTTVSRVGLPAGYLLTSRDLRGADEPKDELPFVMRQRQLTAKVVSATRNAYTLRPEDKRTYVATQDNWLCNLYWGFSLTKPADWGARVTLTSIELTGSIPDIFCKVEALDGTYPVTKETPENISNSLRQSLTKYQKLSAGTVPHGYTTAAVVEFGCVVEGKAMRCRQYLIPRRNRAYRVSCWAPATDFPLLQQTFEDIFNNLKF